MQTIEYRNPSVDKASWGAGPWVTEPDKKQWMDEATGLPCLMVRSTHCSGAWCGYVGVTENHPFFGKEYHDLEDIGVHGGLTFAGKCQEEQNDCEGVCHKVAEGENDNIWWFGFDCAHYMDFSPLLVATMQKITHNIADYHKEEIYRDQVYVTEQVKNLALQLKAIA